jgi:hypothetical protein
MANIEPCSLRPTVGRSLLTLSLMACLGLTACAGGEKTTTTTVQTPGGTVSTTSTTTGTDAATAGSNSIDVKREVEPNEPVDPNNTTVIMGGDAPPGTVETSGDGKVRVDLPGVHVNVDKSNGSKDINVPFVHIHKDAAGDTQIKAPFVHIKTEGGDSQ